MRTHGTDKAIEDSDVQLESLAAGLAQVEGYALALGQMSRAALSRPHQSPEEKSGWGDLSRHMSKVVGCVGQFRSEAACSWDVQRARALWREPADIPGHGVPSLLETCSLLAELQSQVQMTISSPLLVSAKHVNAFEHAKCSVEYARQAIEGVLKSLGMKTPHSGAAGHQVLLRPRQMDVLEVEARISGLLSRLDSMRLDVRSLQASFVDLVKRSNTTDG